MKVLDQLCVWGENNREALSVMFTLEMDNIKESHRVTLPVQS